MENTAFQNLKMQFSLADIDTKIAMYVDAEELTQSQYKELLRLFPLNALNKLEAALG